MNALAEQIILRSVVFAKRKKKEKKLPKVQDQSIDQRHKNAQLKTDYKLTL